MTDAYSTPVPCIYGEGAPTIAATNGVRYIDTVTGIEYVRYGGAWNKTGSGAGAGGLPYTAYDNAGYIYWYVNPPDYLSFKTPYSQVRIEYGNLQFYSKYQIGFLTLANTDFNCSTYFSVAAATGVKLNLPNAPGASGTLWYDAGAANVVKVAP